MVCVCVVCVCVCVCVQVRVFIHSATGQIHEETAEDKEHEVGDTPLPNPHNETTTKSVAMEMTLIEGGASDPYTTITTEQVCRLHVQVI